jgi:hypothetical protein
MAEQVSSVKQQTLAVEFVRHYLPHIEVLFRIRSVEVTVMMRFNR